MYELANFTNNVMTQTEKARELARQVNERAEKEGGIMMPMLNEEEELAKRILLLSLEWPSSLSCSKSADLEDKEADRVQVPRRCLL